MPSINLKTEVPGPKSKAMLARRVAAVPTGLGKATEVVVERAENALKLIGDLYLARVHAAASERFYLREWEASINRKLDIVEDFYQLLTDRVRNTQSHTLELIIILLILFEIMMAIFRAD